MHKVGSVLIDSLYTKKGAFSALSDKNCVLGNYWHNNLRCLSII